MNVENQSEMVALPPPSSTSERSTAGDSQGEVEDEPEVQLETSTNDDTGQTTGNGSVALTQSTLVPYRPPVLPNLAKAALERLQKRNATDEFDDSLNSDFQPPKRRKTEENTQCEGDENEVRFEFNNLHCTL